MSDNQIIEETIHKRLQYKFDRQLTKFASEYLRLGQIEDPAEAKKAAAALLEDVAQLQFENYKNAAALKSIDCNERNNEMESKSISTTSLNSDKNVEQTNKEIAELQNELKRQQLIRRNKEEYNEVAGQVRQYEPRTEMERRIAETEAEIQQLQDTHREEMEVIHKQQQYLRMTLSAFSCLIDCSKKQV